MLNERHLLLDEYKKLKKILEENGIWYSGYAGTAIGAVRDGGFIPWDDDIDILMKYEDYKKLKKLYPDNIIVANDKGFPLFFPKWVPDKTKFLESSVFIDINVIVPTTKKKVKKYRSLKNKIIFGLYAVGHKNHMPFSYELKVLRGVSILLRPFIRSQLDYEKTIDKLIDQDGDIFITIVNPVEKFHNVIMNNFTFEVDNYDFEDTTMPVYKNHKEYLMHRYGSLEQPNMYAKKIVEHIDAVNIRKTEYYGHIKPGQRSEYLTKQKLDILDEVEKFGKIMNKENIWYSLYAGTALGAIRENGFIPWDDDFDVLVEYEGYKKLREKYFENVIVANDEKYPLLFPKWVPSKEMMNSSPTFIDLFVVVRTNKTNLKKYRSLSQKYKFGIYASSHSAYRPFIKRLWLLRGISFLFKPFIRKQLDFDQQYEMLYDPNGDFHVIIVNPVETVRSIFIEDFSKETTEYYFEGLKLPVYTNQSKHLSKKYGGLERPQMLGKKVLMHTSAINIVKKKFKGQM